MQRHALLRQTTTGRCLPLHAAQENMRIATIETEIANLHLYGYNNDAKPSINAPRQESTVRYQGS